MMMRYIRPIVRTEVMDTRGAIISAAGNGPARKSLAAMAARPLDLTRVIKYQRSSSLGSATTALPKALATTQRRGQIRATAGLARITHDTGRFIRLRLAVNGRMHF